MIQTTVFTIIVLLLLIRAIQKRPGIATWHMFTSLNRCRMKLYKDDGEIFNKWDYLPHSHLAMNENELEFFLFYMKEVHSVNLNGEVELVKGEEKTVKKIRNSCVVN